MIELIADYPDHHTTKHSQSSVVIGDLSVKDFSEDCLQTAVLILLHKLSGQSALSIDIISKTGIPACLSVEFESEDTAGQISRKKVVQKGKERSSSFGISYEAAETDMDALFQFVDNGLTISFNSSIYSGKTIREWGERLRIIATQLTREPGIPLSDLDIFLPGEKETILHQWNPSAEDSAYYYRQIDYISEFEKQVENTPHRIAVVDAEKEWTYSQLNSYANVISGKLIEKGITTNQRIGLHVQRSAEMLGSMLGIMKAGGGYVPLEPGLPDDRMTYMATDSGISLAVSQKQIEDVPLLRDSLETIWIDGISADHYCSNPKRKCGPNDLAYVIYTSGSTGKPKGMEIEHHSMVNYVYANIERHEITEDDLYLGSTTIAFDVSVPELFCPLVIGARVHVAPAGIAADGEALGALLESAGITKMNATPTTFQILVSSGWKGKDDLVIMSGGEPINPELANKLQELCQQVYNEYGPCEATVFNTVHKIGEEAGIVPLGTPLLNSRLYVLDDHSNPVPPKVRGRIFIGGDCVVRGYINRPELNIEKFVSDPFSHTKNARMYDTGDVGYWNDGYLYTLGRSDNQVKIRGYRIELGEIENAIAGHPKISEAAVLVREDTPGQKRIVAYTRPVDEMPVSDELQEFLLATLPSYMVPTWFVEIAEFPKTVSGKIDRLSLPVPEVTVTDTEDTPTGNKLASDIAALWQEVLGVREVKTTDILFRLGADSINAVSFQKKLSDYLGRKIPIATIFQSPTAEDLASAIGGDSRSKPAIRNKNQSAQKEIAVIGMAGRFPGAPDLNTYWQNLVNEVETIDTFTPAELESFGVSSADYMNPDYVPRGISLQGAYDFDAGFFDISGAEAEIMDPQVRLFLKTVWESLEDAGYPEEPKENRIGIFAGGGYSTYQFAHLGLQSVERLSTLTGNASDYIATRCAYAFGLTGPAMSVQTACSTSLVAINEACEALRSGRCEMAVAGGVSFSYPHEQGYTYEEGLIYSKDGHCRPFDAKASGTIFSQGAGAVLLKPLEQALQDGDTIHAVIRGVATNNDGNRKGSFAAPSIEGQQQVIEAALADAGISPDEISYVEAHGTGTVIGDPIEVAGLTGAWRNYTNQTGFCPIGSVKSNIGHADAAAGIAGFLKLLLCLKNKTIPATLHYTVENAEMDLGNSPFFVQSKTTKWDSKKRIGSVNAMGLGGTNAHTIVEEAPPQSAPSQASPNYYIFPFSAKSPTSLKAILRKWQEAEFEPDSLNNAAFTLQHGRKEFPFRHAVVAEDFGDLQRSLANPDIQASHELRINRKPVFMFTGQGAQYRKMCYSSYRTDDAFRHAVDQCCRILKDQCDYDLQSILFAESGDAINETRHAQPALFTICYAQAKRWIEWGFQPESLIGHSIGEYVAAQLSGVMSLEDALKTVYTRGKLMQQMEAGDMLAVMDSAETVESLIDDIPNVEVAALNSPFLTAVAGKKEQITEAAGIFSEKGIRHKNLSTSHAFHSKMMEPMLEEFKLAVNQISLNPPSIPYISNLTGKWISDSEATNPDYYAEQLRSSVRFHDGINTITDGESPHLFLEMGPGRTLTTFASDIMAGSDNAILPTLPGPKEGIDSERYTWQALANTWTAGQTLDWNKIMSTEGCRRIPLPTYQFDEKTYRIEPNITTTESKHENLSLFNTPVWKESKSGYAGVPITPGEKTVWLCFISPRSNLDRRILDAAKVTTARKIEIAKGGTFKRYSANRYRINPANEEDYEKLIKQVLNDFGTIGGVIHTWSCHRPKVTKVDHVWNSQATRSLSALWLGKALGGIGNRTPIPVNFVTRGLIKGKGCDLYPANYALSGVVGVIQREYPNLITRTIDLGDRIFDIRTEESLNKVLNGDRHHLRLAMKDGSWWLPTFENDDPDLYRSVEPYREIKEGGIYVITGGLGGLARTIAKDLSTRAGKLTFILITRSSFPERKNWQSMLTSEATDARTRQKILTLLDLEQNGCRAQIVSADLGIPGVMEDTLQAIQRQHERIDGVIHTSGVLRDGAVAMKGKRDVEEVFAAKSIPAQGLYNYFRSPDHNPDFVILFSSVSTDLAAFGQSDYAAANAYLDGIAEQAWSEGQPFFSIAWPAWRDVGMAADTKTENAGASGLSDEIAHNSISPETGAKAFFDIMSCSDSPRTVVSVLHFGNHYQNLLENRQPAANRSDETRSKIEAPVEQMLSLWKRELNNNDITEDDDYFELGGDSLLAVRLLQRIKETFDQAIPMSLLIKAPTARKLIRAMGLDSAEIEQIPGKDLSPHIVPLRIAKGSKETPIFCIHAADGGVMFYQGFASRLEKDRSIYGIESRVFHDDSYQLEADIEAVAAHYLKDIREFRPEGPYIFAGYSFGALVALRMAQLAREQGDTVEGLIIYDMFNPELVRKYSIFERTKVIWDRRSILPFWPRVQSCLGRFGELAKWVCIHKWEYYKYKANKLEEEYSRHVRARYMYESLIPGFCPSEYNGRTLLVVTEDPGDRCDFGEIQGWRNVLKEKMTHRFVTGNHLEIFTGTHLELLVNHTDYFLRGGPQTTYDSHNVVEKEPAQSDTRFVTKEKDQREFAG